MAMLPAEAEDEDSSAGSGGCRGRACFAVGDKVEVCLDEDGFRGAHYVATVTARHPGSGGYQVVFATLLAHRGGPPLLEDVATTHVRPRPPQPPPERMFKRFNPVEAYHSEGWWPGVVSSVRRGRWPRYNVTFPLFREEVELPASLVRRRREFVCGTWIDAQEVLRGIPLYKEGSSVEVMCDEEKQGTAWMQVVKMVGGTNYVVRYRNGECSTEVLHSRFIGEQPVFDMKFEYELEPSTEVEVYQNGIWKRGVIADVSIFEPRRYGVRIKRPYSTDEDDYLLVSSASLRPYSNGDEQEWRPSSTKKHAREDYAVCAEGSYLPESSTPSENSDEEFCSAVLSKPSRDTDQYSFVPNIRARKDVGNKEPQLKHCSHLRKYTARSLSNDSMDMETLADTHSKHIAGENEESDGFRTAKNGGHVLIASTLPRVISKHGGAKQKHCLPKVHPHPGLFTFLISFSFLTALVMKIIADNFAKGWCISQHYSYVSLLFIHLWYLKIAMHFSAIFFFILTLLIFDCVIICSYFSRLLLVKERIFFLSLHLTILVKLIRNQATLMLL